MNPPKFANPTAIKHSLNAFSVKKSNGRPFKAPIKENISSIGGVRAGKELIPSFYKDTNSTRLKFIHSLFNISPEPLALPESLRWCN